MEGGYRMSREIDERIVAMYFDNRNFEKGAQQTIQTLDELKKGMNFEGLSKGSKSFTDLSKKLNLEKVQKGAEKLKTTFGGVGDAIKKAFNLGPIDNVFHALDNFKNKYFDRVLGFDIAQKLASSLENTFRNLTIAPISAGWNQYENTMDSVKTIVSSTGESIDTVKAKLGEMTEYANKTIYSLNDMTSNLGKFTNNGVKLDDATNAMIGLANAAADAGQGAQQASMAMYNVSQAIGVGKMLSIDWKSLENANIATVKLKQTLIDSAVAAGTLDKKMVKNAKTGKEEVQYWTKAEKGAKATQVTVEGFRDSLSKGWLDKQALLNTFAIYSGQLTATEIAALGYSREESERLAKIGEEAMKAAQEVRTFSKMMDALREGVQSTWATSFEYIFGDMQEGTNLWTKLNKLIEDTLNKGAENRNNILMSWRGMAKDENGNVRNIQKMYDAEMELAKKVLEDRKASIHDTPYTVNGQKATAEEIAAAQKAAAEAIRKAEEKYAETVDKINKKFEKYGDPSTWVDYRDVAINALLGVEDAEGNLIKRGLFQDIQEIAKTVKDAFSDVFGVFDDQSLINITKGLSEFADKFTAWLGDASDSESRLSKIRSGLTGVFNILKIGYEIFKSLVSVGLEAVKPLIDPLLNLFSKFGKWLNLKDAKNLSDIIKTLSDRFDKLWKKLTTLGWSGIFDKIGNWMKYLGRKVRDSVSTWLDENGLGDVTKWFVDVGDKIKEGYETVKKWWNESAIGKFFKGIVDSIAGVFATKDAEGNDIEMPIVAWFVKLGDDIKNAWDDGAGNGIANWEIWKTIGDFFTGIWDSIHKAFTPTYDDRGHQIYSPIVRFFKGLEYQITDAFKSVEKWWNDDKGLGGNIRRLFSGIWEAVSGAFATHDADGNEIQMPIIAWFVALGDKIKAAWDDEHGGGIANWEIWTKIKKFFDDIWQNISGLFATKDAKGNDIEMPIIAWFVKLGDDIKNAWDDGAGNGVANWEIWKTIGDFFTGIWDSINKAFQPTYDDRGHQMYSPIVRFFKDLEYKIDSAYKALDKWWSNSGIPEFFQGIFDDVMKAFNGSGEGENTGADGKKKAPIVEFFESLSADLKKIWDGIVGWEGWESVGKFFSDIWGWIIGLFKGDESVVAGTEDVAVAIKDGEKKAKALEESKGFFEQIGEFFAGLFTSLAESVTAIGSIPEANAVLTAISDVIKIVSTIVQTVSDWLGRVTGTSGEQMTGWDWVVPAIIAIASIAIEVYKYKKASNLAKIAEAGGIMTNLGGELLKIAAGVALLAVAVKFLGSIPTDQLVKGGGAVVALGAIMIFLINSMNDLNKTLNKRIMPETSGERIAKHAITAVTIAGTIAEVMALLPNILDKLKGFDGNVNGDAIFKTFSGIAIMISSLILSIAVFNKLGGNQMNVAAAAQGALGIVVALGILLVGFDAVIGTLLGFDEALAQVDSTKFSGLHKQHLDRIKAGGETLAAMAEAIGGFLGAIGGGIAGGFNKTKAAKDSEAAVAAADVLKNVSVEDMQHMADVVGVLSDIQAALPKWDGLWDKWVNGDNLGNLGDNVGRLGEGLGKMVLAINPSELDPGNDIGRLKEYINFLSAFGGVADVLTRTVDTISRMFGSNAYYNPDLINENNMFSTVMAYYMQAAEMLAEAVQEGLGDEDNLGSFKFEFNPTGIITAICRSLEQNGKEDIAKAVRAMIQAGLDSYGGVNEFGDPNVHSTKQIDDSLTHIFELMTSGGQSTGLDSVLSGFLGDLGDSSKLNSLLGQFDGVFDTFGSTISEKLNGNIHFDLDKWLQTDANGNIPALENLETQWNTAIAQFEESGGSNFELQIRPVIDMTNFGTEAQKLQTYFNGALPLSVNATFAFGAERLPINDSNIVNELQLLRTEVANARLFIQSAVNNMGISVGNKITGLGSDIRQMKFYLDTKVLVGGILGGVDQGLGNRANLYGSTGTLPVRNVTPNYIP